MCLVSEKTTDLKEGFFFFFNYNKLCFVISIKKKKRVGIIICQKVAKRNEGNGVYKSPSTVFLFSNCTLMLTPCPHFST